MGQEKTFNQCCIHCGDLLTTRNTNKSLIKDKRYICYHCIRDQIDNRKISHIDTLMEIYDFDNAKEHKKIDKQSNIYSERKILSENKFVKEINIPKSIKKYPIPKGIPFRMGKGEIECSTCKTILTTTNATKTDIGDKKLYRCIECRRKQIEARENDPLYNKKEKIKSMLLELHARRQVRQFTWEYVEQRFAKPAEPISIIYEQEDFDHTVKLFGIEYATKVFAPKPIELQRSFGDLISEEGCNKLISLFQYEIDKSRNRGRRRQEQFAAMAFAESHDTRYFRASPNNSLDVEGTIIADLAYLSYYGGNQCASKRKYTFEEIELSNTVLPDILVANESQKKLIELNRQKIILSLLTDEADIQRQQNVIRRLYEDLRGHENMEWDSFCDNKRYFDYEVSEEFE